MVTEQKHLLRSLRRSHTSTPSSSASSSTSSSPSSSSWIHLRSVLFVVTNSSTSSPNSSDRLSLKSPWSRRRRKRALLPKQWKRLFGPDGKLSDGGVKFLKKVRSGVSCLPNLSESLVLYNDNLFCNMFVEEGILMAHIIIAGC
ncbi:Chromosome alignment-maintaining phosphoprotein 1 [Bienertia sinuspersici]